MCSILGIVSDNVSESVVADLNIRLRHRGPDSCGVRKYEFRDKYLALAHNRLAIQDLSSAANQPLETERYSIVFNGEIYNHIELRQSLDYEFQTHSDTETLIALFESCGVENAIRQLNGMFAIALFDKKDLTLTLVRDRVGIKPLYYSHTGSVFSFASELKGLPGLDTAAVCNRSIVQSICLGYITDRSTIYESVFKLEPGCILTFDGQNAHVSRYWNLPDRVSNDDFETVVEKTEALLRRSVQYRLLSDVEVGCFLSGGIDSSLVAAMMSKECGRRIKTFSIGFDNPKYDESQYARRVSNYLGTDHNQLVFRSSDLIDLLEDFDYYFDEPFGDPSALPSMILSKLARSEVKVALSGDGGDELFLGYNRYFFSQRFYRLSRWLPLPIRGLLSLVFAKSNSDRAVRMAYPVANPSVENWYSVLMTAVKPWELKRVFSRDFLRLCYDKDDLSLLEILNLDGQSLEGYSDLSRVDFMRYLPDDILTKVDRSSMKYALEARVPVLDHNVVEYAYSVKSGVKLENGPKSVLKRILYEHVPSEFFERPKAGFSVPIREWFCDDLKEMLLDKIGSLDDRFNKAELLRAANEHVSGHRNHSYLFWNLMRVR